jgi:hypothetical protein
MKDIEDKILQNAYQVLYGTEEGSKMFNINIKNRTPVQNFKKKKRVTFNDYVEFSRN